MAGEFALQFNTKFGAPADLQFANNQGYGISPDAIPTTNSDASARRFRLGFNDPQTQNVPHQHKNIVADNNVGKRLDFSV